MAGWFANKLRAGRYAMNLKLLEADLLGSSASHRASVLVAAAAVIEKLSRDDFMTGTLLGRAVLEPFGTSAEDAQTLYNTLEDVLTSTEAQRKQARALMATKRGADAAEDLDRQLQVQQQGIRLLMVALARKADESFKGKARSLRECLYDAQSQIAVAVAAVQQQSELTSGLGLQVDSPNYEAIKVNAELFTFACVGCETPNPSLKRSANGRPPGPVWWYAVHFRQPGLGVPPLAPG